MSEAYLNVTGVRCSAINAPELFAVIYLAVDITVMKLIDLLIA